MAIILSLIFGCTLLIWGVSADWDVLANAGFWDWRGQFVLLSGLILFVVMSAIMYLSIRPQWVEKRLGGLDKVYHVHKWLGISCIAWISFHYLAEKLPKWGWVRAMVDFPPRVKGAKEIFIPPEITSLAKSIGEYGIWIFGFLLCVALIQRIPYQKFRWIHKVAFPLFFLALILHGLALMPKNWWLSPIGAWAVLWAVIGGASAIIALLGLIGKKRQYQGNVVDMLVMADKDLVQLDVQLAAGSNMSYKAGQFAFLTFTTQEGAHPFTIVSFDEQKQIVRFAIKNLGDYTKLLAKEIKVGQNAMIEGAYGALDFSDDKPQIWVAGGIGITPFLARMDALKKEGGAKENIHFFCSFRKRKDLYPHDLEKRAQEAGVTLHQVFSDEDGEKWSAEKIKNMCPEIIERASVWFCGPDSFGKAIREDLKPVSFHGELFRFR